MARYRRQRDLPRKGDLFKHLTMRDAAGQPQLCLVTSVGHGIVYYKPEFQDASTLSHPLGSFKEICRKLFA